MPASIEVLFTPADFQALAGRDKSDSICVVFDILRATTSMVTALANGATGIIPVAEISEAVAHRTQQPTVLLAGERNGLRIDAAQTGGVDFDLGNSPREYVRDVVAGKTIVSTTTNGTRALRACVGAKTILAAAFANLTATAQFIAQQSPARIVIICAGTHERTALEDALAAGALCDALLSLLPKLEVSDSAQIARPLYQHSMPDLAAVLRTSENARRLLAIPALRDDVDLCLQRDHFQIVAAMDQAGVVRRAN